MSTEDSDLDPRIQIELENLNSATDEINKLEIELEEANSTFRILLNESTRRLKLSSKKLGSCIEKARPYHEGMERAREAQIECQKAAVKFQRANEIHAAAKETVALAEQRFMSNSHEWKFDNAWQEMLNHATLKVMNAEKQKTDCHTEHMKRTKIFNAAEQKVQHIEERFRRSIAKSRPYFEEKQICQDQLQTQKNRIQELQRLVQCAKSTYSTALRNLERISNDIHRQRGDIPQMMNGSPDCAGAVDAPPPGLREPGVGAELNSPTTTTMPPLPDFEMELEKCDYPSIAGSQISLGSSSHRSHHDLISSSSSSSTMAVAPTNGAVSMATIDLNECSETEEDTMADYDDNTNGELSAIVDEKHLEELRQKVKILAVRPIEGGDGQQEQNDTWVHELKAKVDELDHLMLLNEKKQQQQQKQKFKQQQMNNVRPDSLGAEARQVHSDTATMMITSSIVVDDDDNDVVIITGKAGPLIRVTAAVAAAAHLQHNAPSSLPTTPEHSVLQPIKKLQKLDPLPSVNVSMRELPLLARLSNEILDRTTAFGAYNKQRRRSLE